MKFIGLDSGVLDVDKIQVIAIGVLQAAIRLPLIEARGEILDCLCN
jgi:hypothetical protein